jgi:hypothetical protein
VEVLKTEKGALLPTITDAIDVLSLDGYERFRFVYKDEEQMLVLALLRYTAVK